MSTSETAQLFRPLSGKTLAREIFKAEVAEEIIRELPAQSLYMAIRQNGLQSSSELIQIGTTEQIRLLMDFDFWDGNNFYEENFWEWLTLSDDDDGLALLQKLVKSIDLKLIALLISRHVEVRTFEEPTESPPEAGFYTPDNGCTWLGLKTEDATKQFHLGRLLALLFETNADLFYQLLSIPGVATETMLEEESFQERERRLNGEGVPDREAAYQLNSPLSDSQFLKLLEPNDTPRGRPETFIVEPLIHATFELQPLGQFFDELFRDGKRDDVCAELTRILNAAIVRWSVDFWENEEMSGLLQKARGALNIGISAALEKRPGTSFSSLYASVGLEPLYRLGLGKILALRPLAKKLNEIDSLDITLDPATDTCLEFLLKAFPELPAFFRTKRDGTPDWMTEENILDAAAGTTATKLLNGMRAFASLQDVTSARNFLDFLLKK